MKKKSENIKINHSTNLQDLPEGTKITVTKGDEEMEFVYLGAYSNLTTDPNTFCYSSIYHAVFWYLILIITTGIGLISQNVYFLAPAILFAFLQSFKMGIKR